MVATPIGNLEDMTYRGVRTLNEVDLILAEDTRRTQRLCQHYGISTRLRSMHAHSSEAQIHRLVSQLGEGQSMALVSDGGMPLVSDPGYPLLNACLAEQIRVGVIPGASAVTAAVALSGLVPGGFHFMGFLPRRGTKRRKRLAQIVHNEEACVVFESPHRLSDTLQDLYDALGAEHPIAVCRELTKRFEEVFRGSLNEAINTFSHEVKGELTLVIGGGAPPPDSSQTSQERIKAWLQAQTSQELRTKELATQAAQELGLRRREVYGIITRLNEMESSSE